MTIVIFNPFGIGNTLLLLPFLRNIKRIHPQGRAVMIVTQTVVKDLLESQGLVDEFIFYNNTLSPLKSKTRNLANRLHYVIEMLNLLSVVRKQRPDLLFILTPLSLKLAGFTLLSGAKIRIGYKGNFLADWVLNYSAVADPGEHELEWRSALLRVLEHDAPYERPRLVLSEGKKKEWAHKVSEICNGRPIVGLHPGCSMALQEKRWPPERFAELIHRLKAEAGVYPILFGGPDDKDIAQIIMSRLNCEVPNYVNRLPIMETAAAIANCDVFITNDSGLMHLAAAVNTPVIALFGGTSVTKSMPQVYPRIILDGTKTGGDVERPIMNIKVEHVVTAFGDLLEKRLAI